MDTREALNILNDSIRSLNVAIKRDFQPSNEDLEEIADQLDEVRQFLGRDL